MFRSLVLAASIGVVAAGTILWDGRFNDLSSSTDLNEWSWSNEVGPYQYYIHGPSAVTTYVNLSPLFKNPADSGSSKGVKITLDSTSYWNGQTMRRTELIPQTSAAINAGMVYYHFSMKRSASNPPSIYREHQINFFESHFTEMKAGWISGEAGTSDPLLRWDVGGVTKWSVVWDTDVWHNVVYAINFSAGTVAFYHSTGSDPLALTVAAVTASTSSNGADWHLGVLELPVSGQADGIEDYYFSGVYVETGSLTTSVTGPGGPVVSSSPTITAAKTTSKVASPTNSSEAASSTMTTVMSTSSAIPGSGTIPKWGQCGGQNYKGPTSCVSGTTCTILNAWYYQCL